MQMIKRIFKEEKGLTLIELLAVIVILGVIAAIAVPAVSGLIDSTKKKANDATARQIYESARLYITTEKDANFVNQEVKLQTLLSGKYFDSAPKVTKDDGNQEALDPDKTIVDFENKDSFTVTLVTTPSGFTKEYQASDILK